MVIYFYHGFNGLDGLFRMRDCEQDKNQDKPLGEDGGRCPDAMLPLWSYKSELLTTKSEAYQHLPLEGHHPLQGDKQK